MRQIGSYFGTGFSLCLSLGTGHLALNAVLSLLLSSCSEREQGEKHTCGKMNWLRFPLCPPRCSAARAGKRGEMGWGAVPGGALVHLDAASGTGGCRLLWGGCRRSCAGPLRPAALVPLGRAEATRYPRVDRTPQIHGNIWCPAVAEPSGRPGCLGCLQSPPSP